MNLSGVGEKTERKLKKIGILKAEDFLQYYPNHYEYFPYLTYLQKTNIFFFIPSGEIPLSLRLLSKNSCTSKSIQ